MKKLFTALCLFILPLLASAQEDNPVKWAFSAKKLDAQTYELTAKATIEKGWHLYSQFTGEGPVPTSFNFAKNPLLTLDGKVKEVGKMKTEFDPNFKSDMKFYESTVSFTQKIKVKGKANAQAKGTVEFMVCDDHQCLPPTEVPFTVSLK
jgi:hypothetical protein